MYPNEKESVPNPSQNPLPPQNNGKGPLPSYTAATASASSSQAFQTRFASVSMHMEDRLRFLHFPDQTFNICRQVVHTTWKRGIQEEREYGGSMEIKLYGHPWRGSGEESVDARRLICAILGALHSQGWVLTLSTDISKKNWDKDTLLFRHQVPSPAECEWCCIGFSKTDRIKFIDGKSISIFVSIHLSTSKRLGRTDKQSKAMGISIISPLESLTVLNSNIAIPVDPLASCDPYLTDYAQYRPKCTPA
jgi:hypothetical protein